MLDSFTLPFVPGGPCRSFGGVVLRATKDYCPLRVAHAGSMDGDWIRSLSGNAQISQTGLIYSTSYRDDVNVIEAF